MAINQLEEYRKKIQNLSKEEQIHRDLYLRKLALGEIYGPLTGLPSLDKPWLKFYTEEQIKNEVPNMTIYEYFKYQNRHKSDEIVIDDQFKKYTYKELFALIDATAQSLHKLGITKNKVILGMLPQFVHEDLLLYGVDKAGGAISFIIPNTPIDEIIQTINLVQAKLLFIFDGMLKKDDEVKIYEQTQLEHLVVVSPNPFYKGANKKTMTWNEFMKIGRNYVMPEVNRNPEDLLFIAKTGGSTGVPKNVMLNDRGFNTIVHQYLNSSLMEKYQDGDKWLRIWPLFSATAAVSSNHLPLCAGLQLVLRIVPKIEDFPKVLLETKANHLTLVPAYLDALKNSPLIDGQDLSFVKSAGCGGMKMPIAFEKSTEEFFKEHGINSFLGCGYGCTENSSVATIRMSPETAIVGGTGVPMVKTNVTVFNPDTEEELSYGEEGEICFSDDAFMMGYLGDNEQTKKVIRTHKNGEVWLHTGDLGTIEPDTAQVNVNGRMTRTIQYFPDYKIYPTKIEEVIAKIAGVETVAVVAAPDREHEGYFVAAAVIVVQDGYNPEEVVEVVNATCVATFPPYSVPRKIVVKDYMPLVTIGKPDVVGLEKELAENTGLTLKKKN